MHRLCVLNPHICSLWQCAKRKNTKPAMKEGSGQEGQMPPGAHLLRSTQALLGLGWVSSILLKKKKTHYRNKQSLKETENRTTCTTQSPRQPNRKSNLFLSTQVNHLQRDNLRYQYRLNPNPVLISWGQGELCIMKAQRVVLCTGRSILQLSPPKRDSLRCNFPHRPNKWESCRSAEGQQWHEDAAFDRTHHPSESI